MKTVDELAAAEAYELHDYLTEHGIPDLVYSTEKGTIMDAEGKHFYYLSLQDRVMLFVERFIETKKPSMTSESEVRWIPWQPKESLSEE